MATPNATAPRAYVVHGMAAAYLLAQSHPFVFRRLRDQKAPLQRYGEAAHACGLTLDQLRETQRQLEALAAAS